MKVYTGLSFGIAIVNTAELALAIFFEVYRSEGWVPYKQWDLIGIAQVLLNIVQYVLITINSLIIIKLVNDSVSKRLEDDMVS